MSGKGDKYRKVDYGRYRDNWDKIFNKDKQDLAYESDNPLERPYEPEEINEASKEERLREFIGLQYSESYRLTEKQNPYFQEGSVRYAQHSVQYHASTENHR